MSRGFVFQRRPRPEFAQIKRSRGPNRPGMASSTLPPVICVRRARSKMSPTCPTPPPAVAGRRPRGHRGDRTAFPRSRYPQTARGRLHGRGFQGPPTTTRTHRRAENPLPRTVTRTLRPHRRAARGILMAVPVAVTSGQRGNGLPCRGGLVAGPALVSASFSPSSRAAGS